MFARRAIALAFILIITGALRLPAQSCDPPKCGTKTKKVTVTWEPRLYTWQKTGSTMVNNAVAPATGGVPFDDVARTLVANFKTSTEGVRVSQAPNQCRPAQTCFCQLGTPVFFEGSGTRTLTGPYNFSGDTGTVTVVVKVRNQTAVQDGICEPEMEGYVPGEWMPPSFP